MRLTPPELRAWRTRMGLSVRKAAGLLGVERETLRIWECSPDDKMLPIHIGLACTAIELGITEYMPDVSGLCVRKIPSRSEKRISRAFSA